MSNIDVDKNWKYVGVCRNGMGGAKRVYEDKKNGDFVLATFDTGFNQRYILGVTRFPSLKAVKKHLHPAVIS
ncbi:MAG: hypothetical protein UV00_C0009G0024 [candidate division WWE3 bacterium GW2011_GWF1_42_14]|uniref:Uncharacterized protein n=2 Tax=Katanobacteria TaxID=422282 RepID=A0A0G0YN09_UNCKA|nr:MAG: hypothetical protein UU92_C0002G0024 [candidate division WWE3 bacterium GW2011_GWA1_42_12]KKS38075.1 MAG: hypothetical protein UV00_C0009G0024 [candidate division WWE3 bacterium GW2011_GWF1_42_14]KKS40389.1 MAG: hypothetical protein UV03_C0007G0024 [candidate division WWE3 bacterium GW2011_GWE1_42_16]KKS66592.1 MAG: hypothetical protein UV35_C0011G0025 [candidate division WWE3 bacterium GW2011_GWB1_42_6]